MSGALTWPGGLGGLGDPADSLDGAADLHALGDPAATADTDTASAAAATARRSDPAAAAAAGPVRRQPGSPGDLPDPALPDAALGGFYAVWKGVALVHDGLSPFDPIQGSIGDCFFISALSAVALHDPDALRRRITDHGDGTYTVRFHERKDDGQTVQIVPVDIRVDADLVVDGSALDASALAGGAVLSEDTLPAFARGGRPESGAAEAPLELWPAIIEKAYAQWKGGFEAIANGGYMHESLTALTGHENEYVYVSSKDEAAVFGDLAAALRERRPVITSTRFPKDGAVAPGLDAGHAYTVMAATERGGERYVTLRNPWAKGEPGADGKDDGVFEIRMAEYRRNFDIAVISTGKAPPPPPPPPPSLFDLLFGGRR